MTTSTLDGNELIDEIGKQPTMDRYFDRNPKELSDSDLLELIETERANRAAFITKRNAK